jgi:hypothetical protein
MRIARVMLLAAALTQGCSTTASRDRPAPPPDRPTLGRPPKPAASQPKSALRAAVNPLVKLDERVQGKIVSVNPVLRFVVMEFPVQRMPALDQRLNIYRQGQKVGEVKVTGPTLETTVAGDILTGEAQVEDEVRED